MPELEEWEVVLVAAVLAGILTALEARRIYRQAVLGKLGPVVRLNVSLVERAQDHLGRMAPGPKLEDRIQDAYLSAVRRLSLRLEEGSVTLAEWHEQVQMLIAQHLVEQALAGSGSTASTPARLRRVEEALVREQGYLARFAVAILAAGVAMSGTYIANRAELYGGAGRAMFYQEAERKSAGRYGWVAAYVARDDERTCGPCAAAERNGPYLPGTDHPLPGTACLGRHRCRCEIVLRYDLAAYQRLAGQRVAA